MLCRHCTGTCLWFQTFKGFNTNLRFCVGFSSILINLSYSDSEPCTGLCLNAAVHQPSVVPGRDAVLLYVPDERSGSSVLNSWTMVVLVPAVAELHCHVLLLSSDNLGSFLLFSKVTLNLWWGHWEQMKSTPYLPPEQIAAQCCGDVAD